jgi:hypothetical protein
MAQSQVETGNKKHDTQFWISMGVAILGTVAACATQSLKSEVPMYINSGLALLAYANILRLELIGKSPRSLSQGIGIAEEDAGKGKT